METAESIPLSPNRRGLLMIAAVWLWPDQSCAKSYSQNARNLERLNAGDASAGSVYDNDPKTEAARKRRAMTGCKVSSARRVAMSGSEKDCNMRVLSGDVEFMLEALRQLDCPTCPYGIRP